jgi:hypothetical protein
MKREYVGAEVSVAIKPKMELEEISPSVVGFEFRPQVALSRSVGTNLTLSAIGLPAQRVDATQASNLSAGVSNCKVSRGRSFS